MSFFFRYFLDDYGFLSLHAIIFLLFSLAILILLYAFAMNGSESSLRRAIGIGSMVAFVLFLVMLLMNLNHSSNFHSKP